jgi:radical SAM protein with 4Fe4S-binding SPASM domain
MPKRGLAIIPSGEVLPCSNLSNYVLGNIYYQSLEEILNGEPVSRLRELIENNDYRYCWKYCNCNLNPSSNIPGAVSNYIPAYKKAFNNGNYKKVIEILKLNQNLETLEPDAIYSYAFSLHLEGTPEEALKYYNLALAKGFPEFWVRYNRGSLYLDISEYEKSYSDLNRAIQLNPDHEGARSVMEQLKTAARQSEPVAGQDNESLP